MGAGPRLFSTARNHITYHLAPRHNALYSSLKKDAIKNWNSWNWPKAYLAEWHTGLTLTWLLVYVWSKNKEEKLAHRP